MFAEKIRFVASNLQKGVEIIHFGEVQGKAEAYAKEKERNVTQRYATNVRRRKDYTLLSRCRDRVVEEYLHSKRYHFGHIGVMINPFVYAPQSAVLLLYAKNKVSIRIKVVSGQKNSKYEDISSDKCYHRISITGLEKGFNQISLSMIDRDGTCLQSRSFHIYLSETDTMETNPVVATKSYGKSAFSKLFITGGNMNPFVFNSNGSVFHHLRLSHYHTSTYGAYPFGNHKMLWPVRNVCAPSFANPHSALLYEMDFMGRVTRTYHVKNGIHHFVYEMPNRNLVTFSSSMQHYGTVEEGHTEDTIIEIERNTGRIVQTIYLKDLLGDRYADMVDWVHGNALEYDETEDTMLICMRNVHTVLKFNWTTKEILWVLALPSIWEGTPLEDKVLQPIGEVAYSFQAHAAYEIKDFNINRQIYRTYLVFDNHRLNRRPIEGLQEDGNSYINIYAVNEHDGTVRQLKHLKVDMSIVRSNARYDLSSNRILNMSGCMTRDHEDYRGKVEEYDYATEKVVNQWFIRDDFFSGYEFKWHSDDYCVPIADTGSGSYCCGEAEVPVAMAVSGEETAENIDPESFSKPLLEENYFYFYTKDHSVDYLLFVGEKGTYAVDYTKTWQTTAIHMGRSYYCVISLANIPEDNYQIKVGKENRIYQTGYCIRVGGNVR